MEVAFSWSEALDYFRKRKGAIFYAHQPIFENHSHSHQSLPITLADHGIPTVFFDGMKNRNHRIVIPPNAPKALRIRPLPTLRGRRFSIINEWSAKWQARHIEKLIKQMGGNPLIWVHGAIDEALATRLPYIDVFSFYDDPYLSPAQEIVLRRSKAIAAQNHFVLKRFGNDKRAFLALPPGGFNESEIDATLPPASLPPDFPKRRMGFVGSLFNEYFDYDRFEILVRNLPDWGFVLAGRTDTEGELRLKVLKNFPNVIVLPVVPRRQVAQYWKLLDVCVLCYRPRTIQWGSFASKALEALYFGCSLTGRLEPKTEYLSKDFPFVIEDKDLVKAAIAASKMGQAKRQTLLRELREKMDPRYFLTNVADRLR